MEIRPLSVVGAFEVSCVQYSDARGVFLEWFRPDQLAAQTGYEFRVAQANCSVSARGVVRGIHFAQTPPGQAKYVTCVRGAVWDVVVDLRQDSPGFRTWDSVRLDDVDRRAVVIAEGLGHAFCALTDEATVSYLCSTTYDPEREHTIHPFDPQVAIAWPGGDLRLSERDAAAPTLAEVRAAGLLPTLGGVIGAGAARHAV